MGKQAKPKPNKGERNPDRKNGKAPKQNGSSRNRRGHVTPLQAILLGGGMLVGVDKRWKK